MSASGFDWFNVLAIPALGFIVLAFFFAVGVGVHVVISMIRGVLRVAKSESGLPPGAQQEGVWPPAPRKQQGQ